MEPEDADCTTISTVDSQVEVSIDDLAHELGMRLGK